MKAVTGKKQQAVTDTGETEFVKSAWRRFDLNQGIKPIAGAVMIGGVTAVIATELGVSELAIALLAGYASYRMLKYGLSLPQALVEGIKLEKGILPI